MKWLRWLLLLIALLVVLALGWVLFGGRSRPTPPAASKVAAATLRDPALIAKGEYLTTVGDCAGCHTAQGGARYAGGRSLATPFGNIPVPNITPDRETGLGDWSFEDFWQALHAGKGRHGELLYPAFSYTSYTKVHHDDALAIFAYLQSLAPVHQPAVAPALAFPYSVRNSLKAWRALYFREGEFKPDPAQSAEWNRGAYLVQGSGPLQRMPCGARHARRHATGRAPHRRPDPDAELVRARPEHAEERRPRRLERAGHCRPAEDRPVRQGRGLRSDGRRGVGAAPST